MKNSWKISYINKRQLRWNYQDTYRFAGHMNNLFKSEIYSDVNGILYVNFLNNLFDDNVHIGLFKIYASQLNKLPQ